VNKVFTAAALPPGARRVLPTPAEPGVLAVSSDELFELGILGAPQTLLYAPGGGYHGGVLVGVEAHEYVAVALGQVAQPLYFRLGGRSGW
jgi:hypothetical protein